MKAALFSTPFIILLLTGLLLLAGLAVGALLSSQTSVTIVQSEAVPSPTIEPFITSEFSLVTVSVDGKLAYRGVGGKIDGLINPELHVRPGEIVRITLINGDGMPHDMFLPDFKVKSNYVAGFGDQTEIIFELGEALPDYYVYYCTLPGHRTAGQEGLLVIDEQAR